MIGNSHPPRARLYVKRIGVTRATIHCKGHRFRWDEQAQGFTCCGFLILPAPKSEVTVVLNAQGQQLGQAFLWPEHAAEYLALHHPHEYRSDKLMLGRDEMRATVERALKQITGWATKKARSTAYRPCQEVLKMLDNPAIPMGQIIESGPYRAIVQYEILTAPVIDANGVYNTVLAQRIG